MTEQIGLGFMLGALLPENDAPRDRQAVAKVNDEEKTITFESGWSLGLPSLPEGCDYTWSSLIHRSDPAIIYSEGNWVRGLYIVPTDETRRAHPSIGRAYIRVFYRTKEEHERWADQMLYGKDARDLLTRWDGGKLIHTVSMGGLGPGYEQVIHIICFEVLRHLLEATDPPYHADDWKPELVGGEEAARENWKRDHDRIHAAILADARISSIGPSGAQVGAAISLAVRFFMNDNPGRTLKSAPPDRHITVSKNFPSL